MKKEGLAFEDKEHKVTWEEWARAEQIYRALLQTQRETQTQTATSMQSAAAKMEEAATRMQMAAEKQEEAARQPQVVNHNQHARFVVPDADAYRRRCVNGESDRERIGVG